MYSNSMLFTLLERYYRTTMLHAEVLEKYQVKQQSREYLTKRNKFRFIYSVENKKKLSPYFHFLSNFTKFREIRLYPMKNLPPNLSLIDVIVFEL